MLLALIPSARILTYEWNANFAGSASTDIFSGHAETLLMRIHAERSRRHPTIFVASGFGGLLANALVSEVHRRIYADGFKPEVLRYTVGVTFLGTPFRGCEKFASTAAELRLLVAQQTGAETGFLHSSDWVSYLKEGSAVNASSLDELVQEFSKLIHDRAFKFPITCFFEGRPTNFEKMLDKMSEAERESLRAKIGSQRVMVSRSSSCLPGIDVYELDASYSMMHRYNKPTCENFLTVSFHLGRFAKEASRIL
ncbi:hypothetical protein RB594_001965 [Gaeumannomyces avenae]